MEKPIETLLAATRNPGKEREIRQLLGGLGVRVVSLCDFPTLPECGEAGCTFAENARIKSSHYHHMTGLPALGDDSGLVVDALGGAPGVYSARWAGPAATDADRIVKLLDELSRRPGAVRTARFICAVSFVMEGREQVTAEGACEGLIIDSPRGTGGFGYDPVFLVPQAGRTYAELNPEEKNNLSHRGRALALFRERFRLLIGNKS